MSYVLSHIQSNQHIISENTFDLNLIFVAESEQLSIGRYGMQRQIQYILESVYWYNRTYLDKNMFLAPHLHMQKYKIYLRTHIQVLGNGSILRRN